MATVKRIVCLANSRKLNGFCVAGKDIGRGRPAEWIRPVSARPTEEVSLVEQRYEDGSRPSVLDIIDVPVAEPRASGHQRENWLLDSRGRWSKLGHFALGELGTLADRSAPLWANNRSTSAGLHDEVSLAEAAEMGDSLRLIRVPHMMLSVMWHWKKVGVQGRFSYLGDDYWLWVTDPVYEEPYKREPFGTYELGESWLTVSLTEPFVERQACYKVIAAIIRAQ